MLWFILSLVTALAMSTEGVWLKKFFSYLGPYEMGMYSLVYSFPLFLLTLCLIHWPTLDSTFWFCTLISLLLNAAAYILYMRAIQASPLSLSLPFLAFTPAFMIVTGYIILDEVPNPYGALGIMITLLGGYILNLDTKNWNPIEPLRAILKEEGSRLMLIVSFIYSFTSVLDKKAILHSSPVFYGILFYMVLGPALVFSLAAAGKVPLDFFKKHPLKGMVAGSLLFLQAVAHVWAISLAKAAYMISVKRLSVLFSVIYGWLIFDETHLAKRFSGTILMLTGAVVIALWG